MARIFGRSDGSRTDVSDREVTRDDVHAGARDDVEVVPDRDPVVVHDDAAARERVLADDEIRERVVREELDRRGLVTTSRLGNATATAGLVLAIVGVAMGIVPVLFPGALLLGVVALFASLVARRRARGDELRAGGVRAWLGILLSLAAIALGVVGMLIVADVINTFDSTIADAVDELREADTRLGNWFD